MFLGKQANLGFFCCELDNNALGPVPIFDLWAKEYFLNSFICKY